MYKSGYFNNRCTISFLKSFMDVILLVVSEIVLTVVDVTIVGVMLVGVM